MSKVADFMYGKYVAPLEEEFINANGRAPTNEEDAALWQRAFDQAEAEAEAKAEARKEGE